MNTGTRDDLVEIDLLELAVFLIRKLWLIILCGLIAGGIGYGACKVMQTPVYQSGTFVYIVKESDANLYPPDDAQLTKEYVALIKSRFVLEQVIEQYGLEMSYEGLAGKVSVEIIEGTRIIRIAVNDQNASMAKKLADAIRKVSSERITEVMDIDEVSVVSEANVPDTAIEPPARKWAKIGGALGVFLCSAVLIILFLLDDTIKTADDIEAYLGLSTLAVIPEADRHGGKTQNRKADRS